MNTDFQDVVVINGTSTVYEIKSEFDSLSRLENQIRTYREVFDHINVITSYSQVNKLESKLPNLVGILVITNRNTISTIRESESNKKNVKLDTLFNSLRKTEYIRIIKEFYKIVPNVPNTQIYKECKNLFCKIPTEIAHDLTIGILRTRCDTKTLREFIKKAPSSLSAYAMSICTEKEKMKALMSKFSTRIDSVFIL